MPHPGGHPAPPTGFRYDAAPRRVYWELTRACDLACRHCRAEAQTEPLPDELGYDEVVAGLAALARANPKPVVVLTGGDPLKRPDFWQILDEAKRLGLHVDVAPSVTPRLTRDVIFELARRRVGAMSLSLDGSTPQLHDGLRGVPGCYERTLEAARDVHDAKIPLQVNTLVTANTLADLPAIHGRVAEMWAKRWSLFFLVTTGRGSLLPQITPQQAEDLSRWLLDLTPSSPFVIATTEAPMYRRFQIERRGGDQRVPGAGMRDGNGILFISCRGDLSPSGFLPLVAGNLRQTDPLEVYRSSPLMLELRDTAGFSGRCGRCSYRDACGGSRGRAYAASGNPLSEDPLCTHQPS